MPRPILPKAQEIVGIAKALRDEGINFGAIRCADGTEITWGEGLPRNKKVTEFDKWKAKRDAS